MEYGVDKTRQTGNAEAGHGWVLDASHWPLCMTENTQRRVEVKPEGNPWEQHIRKLLITFHFYDKLPEQVHLHKKRGFLSQNFKLAALIWRACVASRLHPATSQTLIFSF